VLPCRLVPTGSTTCKLLYISERFTVSNRYSIIGLITPALVQHSPYGAFAFFAVFSFLSGVWTYFAVPETSGRSLEDMDAVWGDDQGRSDKERTSAVVSRLERELAEARGISGGPPDCN